MPTLPEIDEPTREVLIALARRKNVLVSGPPGTGKSRLINQVRNVFAWVHGDTGASPHLAIPIPPATSPIPDWFPSPDRTTLRQSFPTVFDQNTKHRDFMRGLVPAVGQAGTFEVSSGTLYAAAELARQPGNAALVIVDEINRGPAVAAFGSALVALEPDKRLAPDGTATPTTQTFEILADDGGRQNYALPHDLYILAAMNEADTSVEPLDVAFLRRFAPIRLVPLLSVAYAHFGLVDEDGELPADASEPEHLYRALVRAWARLNDRISLVRGPAYQLGHGGLMHREAPTGSLANANGYVAEAWSTIRAHMDEVFYGDTRAISELLAAEDPVSPYHLREELFAGQSVSRVDGPSSLSADQVYALLTLVGRS